MMSNDLITTNQNAKLVLEKSKTLIDVTKKILQKKDEAWIEKIFAWSDQNIIQPSTYFPKNKDDLLRMKNLSLRWNRLTSLPDELFNLQQIEVLELNNNILEYISSQIGKMIDLKHLNLNINNLKLLPKEIIQLKQLEMLNIKNNKHLVLDDEQISWLIELKKNGCNVIYDKYKFNLGG
jgi:Leucine-rich repeat (LRR) protein